MKRKSKATYKDHTYFITWIGTYAVTALIWAFTHGFVDMLLKFLLPERVPRLITLIAIGTVLMTAALSVMIYRVGKELNRTSHGTPVALIVSDAVTAVLMFGAVSVIFKNQYIINPTMNLMADLMYSGNNPDWSHLTQPMVDFIPIALIQMVIFMAVPMCFYFLAKKRLESTDEVLKLLHAEKKAAEKREPKAGEGTISELAAEYEFAMKENARIEAEEKEKAEEEARAAAEREAAPPPPESRRFGRG